jgi:hypothetical protein
LRRKRIEPTRKSSSPFPQPSLTEQNKTDLTRCAEDILLARERNDETLERIYLGRRFKNDTERLEKLFELYTQMTAKAPAKKAPTKRIVRRK